MRESSARRKKPRRDGSGVEREEMTETDETAIAACPVWVNPKRSKWIMDRESEVIFRVLISAMVEGTRVRRMGIRRKTMRSSFVIFGE